MKLSDILMLPERTYQNLSDRKTTLCLGIIFIGIADLAIYFIDEFKKLFVGQSSQTLLYNISLAILLVIAMGLIDIMFFVVPLFDLFKMFKKDKDIKEDGQMRVKLAKVYILAHTIIVPVNIIVYFVFRNANNNTAGVLTVLAAYISLIVWVWFSMTISRGINLIYSFQLLFKRVVLLVVFIWTLLTGSAIDYIIRNWIMMLFGNI